MEYSASTRSVLRLAGCGCPLCNQPCLVRCVRDPFADLDLFAGALGRLAPGCKLLVLNEMEAITI